MGQANLNLSCSGDQPIPPSLLPALKDSQTVGTVMWRAMILEFPRLGFSFPPSVAALGSTHPSEMNESLILHVLQLGSLS